MTNRSAVRYTLADVRMSLRPEVFSRGEAYARAGRVSDVKITNLGDAIAARVRGTRIVPYDVTVYVSHTRSGRTLVSGYCACPVAADCKHVAATLIAALDAHADPASVLDVPPPRVADARTIHRPDADDTAQADPRVDYWLDAIRASVPDEPGEPVAGKERIAYVLARQAPRSNAFPVGLVVVRFTKAQRWAKIRETTSEALAAASARAIGVDDAHIGRFMQVYERTSRGRADLAAEL